MDLNTIKRRLRQIHQSRKDMSTAQMARAAGVNDRTMRRYLDPEDETAIPLLVVIKLCQEYAISIDQLVYGGGTFHDGDTEREWRRTIDWWTTHLNLAQKRLLLTLFQTIWKTALTKAGDNARLVNEVDEKIKI